MPDRKPSVNFPFHTSHIRKFPKLMTMLILASAIQCAGCSDPRYRGWYASAASARKDVIIIIDTSSSMSFGNRMAHAKSAASWVLNTLTEHDFAMVVAFGDDAQSFRTHMLPMNAVNRKQLQQFISGLVAHGETMMSSAFDLAFTILNSSPRGLSSSGCSRIILHLGDGTSDGDDPILTIRQHNGGPYTAAMDSYQDFVRIFTYGFGNDIVDECGPARQTLKQIACENGGVFAKIADEDGIRLKNIMANYFVILAAGLAPSSSSESASVNWADVYEDGQGRGRMTAACARVYDFANRYPRFFGVVCLGFPLANAEALQGWETEWASIASTQNRCQQSRLTWDLLEFLRQESDFTEQCAVGCSENLVFGVKVGSSLRPDHLGLAATMFVALSTTFGI